MQCLREQRQSQSILAANKFINLITVLAYAMHVLESTTFKGAYLTQFAKTRHNGV